MEKLYDRINWHNDTDPAINENNLNRMDKAIDDIDDRVVNLAGTITETVPEIKEYLDESEDLVERIETMTKNPPYIGANGNWYVFNTNTMQYEDSGVDASITVQIADITMLPYIDAPYVTNSGTSTDPVFHLFLPRAATISSVEKTQIVGNVDTYTMTLQDGSQFYFTVTNGTGSGDMKAVDYDPQGTVASTGGMIDYLQSRLEEGLIEGSSHSIGRHDSNYFIHAEGIGSTVATGAKVIHTEGLNHTISDGTAFSHIEGSDNYADGLGLHAEGAQTYAIANYVHTEGIGTTASASSAHAEGTNTYASGQYAHSEGIATTAKGTGSHAEGNGTRAFGNYSHAEGQSSYANGLNSHAEGNGSTCLASAGHAEGNETYISSAGTYGHTEGHQTSVTKSYAHAEGFNTLASGQASHVEGQNGTATGQQSHSEGNGCDATGSYSHAEGCGSVASGSASHAEGQYCTAEGSFSHAGGCQSQASAGESFAHGYNCTAGADYSAVFGYMGETDNIITQTNNLRMFAVGHPGSSATATTYNPFYVESSQDYGNDMEPKKNIFTLDEKGNMFLRGFPYNVKGVINNRLIASGDYYILEDGAAYILWTNTRMANNGAWRGAQAYYIVSPFSPQQYGTGATTTALAVAQHVQFANIGTAGLTLQKTTVSYTDNNGHTAYHARIGIGSCVANCCVRYALIKVIGSEADFSTLSAF